MPKLKNSSAGHLEINLGINFQDQLKKVWNVDFWGQNSLHNVYNFWTNNVWFRRVPVIRFGWNFEWMHKILFRKIYIPASRLYDLIENPRSLEAASGQTEPRSFRPPYMVLKWLPLVSGCQICVYIWWKYAIKETYLRKRDNDFFQNIHPKRGP